ncbi:MAG: thioredoxin domain-containing protein [Chloroflexota bacterium]
MTSSHVRMALALLLAFATVLPLTAQTATPEATSTPAGDITPAQSISRLGYPRLGERDAPVNVVEYCALDSRACADFSANVFPALLPYIENGQVVYTFVPLYGMEDVPNARVAARAAICAAEQGGFWPYSRALFAFLAAGGEAPFASGNLTAALDAVELDRATWDECMLSERPDGVLEAAAAQAELQPGFTGENVPFIQIDGVPALSDSDSLIAAIELELQDHEAAGAEATPEATEELLIVTVEPLLGERIEPPLEIELPDGWRYGYDALVLRDVDNVIRTIPLAIYTGPVTGGRGFIVLLWGFPNLIAGNPLSGAAIAPDLWSDGLRLLRLAVVEQGCNIGTDLRTSYSVGELPASGTQFSAVDCPQLPDTRGWFAGLQEGGINFVFYVYTEPIEAMNVAEDQLQLILDSVRFTVPEAAATLPPTGTETPALENGE